MLDAPPDAGALTKNATGGNAVFELDSFPECVEAGRISDDVSGSAYERVSHQVRALFKTNQALVQAAFREQPDELCCRLASRASGFILQRVRRPVDWVLVHAGGAEAARLSAVLMAVRLAGVGMPLVVFPSGLAPSDEALTVLELCGIEHAFCLDGESTETLVRVLASHGLGRLVTFGAERRLGLAAVETGVVWHPLPAVIRVRLDPALSRQIRETVRALLPSAVLAAEGEASDVFYHAGGTPPDPKAALQLAEPLAGCWLEPSLPPEFFTEDAFSASLLQNDLWT